MARDIFGRTPFARYFLLGTGEHLHVHFCSLETSQKKSPKRGLFLGIIQLSEGLEKRIPKKPNARGRLTILRPQLGVWVEKDSVILLVNIQHVWFFERLPQCSQGGVPF